MKIKMNTSIGSADFSYAARQVVEVEDELAAKWVASGIAEEIQGPPVIEHAQLSEIETPESLKKLSAKK